MFSLATCGLVALSLVALAGLIYFLLRYLYWRVDPFYANIPHIPPEVLFGSVRHMGLMSGLSIGEGIAHLHNRLGRPPMMQLWLGKHHVISLHDPDYIKTLFSHHNIFLGKTPLMDAVTLPIFTEGSIINFDGEQHRRLASTVIPVLKRHKLGLWTPLIQHKADRLIQMWQLKAGGRTERLFSHQVNIEADFQLPVMDVVNTLILGSDMRAIDEKILSIVKNEKDSEQDGFPTMPSFSTSDRKTSAELVWSVQQVNNEFGKVTVTALPPFLSKLRLKLSPSYRKALSLLSNRIDRLFELSLTLQAPEEDEGDNIDVEGTNTTTTTAAGVAPTVSPVVPTDGTGDFVHWETFQHTALFRFGRAIASNTISRPLALNNLFSLSSAAGETVIATLCWMTWYLTSYPEVQEKCRQELREHGLMPEDINGTHAYTHTRAHTTRDEGELSWPITHLYFSTRFACVSSCLCVSYVSSYSSSSRFECLGFG